MDLFESGFEFLFLIMCVIVAMLCIGAVICILKFIIDIITGEI